MRDLGVFMAYGSGFWGVRVQALQLKWRQVALVSWLHFDCTQWFKIPLLSQRARYPSNLGLYGLRAASGRLNAKTKPLSPKP